MTTIQHTILIVGASRGIGLGLVHEYLTRGWRVIATERHPSASTALGQLASTSHGALRVEAVDINLAEQVQALVQRLHSEKLDIVLVNAGIMVEPSAPLSQLSEERFAYLMLTNVLSPVRTIEMLAGQVSAQGTLCVMSSFMGSITENTTGGADAYRASKAALNSLLCSYAARSGHAHTLLALHPGWVKTDMGGPDAPVTIDDSVKGLADTITQRSGKPGVAFVDFQNRTIPW